MSVLWAELQLRSDAVSAFVVLLVLWWSVRKWAKGSGIATKVAEDALVTGVFAALVVGRVVWIAVEAPHLFRQPFDFVRLQSGIDYPAAAATFALVGWIEARRRAAPLAEFFGLALMLAVGSYAGLCLFRGDCYGRVAAYPFGIRFPQFSAPRLPIGIYEFVALAIVLVLLPRRLRPTSFLFLALAALALVEFATEFGRVGSISRFTAGWRWGWLLLGGASVALAGASRLLPARSAPPEQP